MSNITDLESRRGKGVKPGQFGHKPVDANPTDLAGDPGAEDPDDLPSGSVTVENPDSLYPTRLGSNYVRGRSTKETAVCIRADLKKWQAAGVIPADWKVRVRTRSFAGGSSIDVEFETPMPSRICPDGYVFAPREPADALYTITAPCRFKEGEPPRWTTFRVRAGESHHIRACDVAVAEVARVRDRAQALMDSYNCDRSNSMVDYFDVDFYGHVSVRSADGVPDYQFSDRPQLVRVL